MRQRACHQSDVGLIPKPFKVLQELRISKTILDNSEEVAILRKGDVVHVAEKRNNRARVIWPVKGYCDEKGANMDAFIQVLNNERSTIPVDIYKCLEKNWKRISNQGRLSFDGLVLYINEIYSKIQ